MMNLLWTKFPKLKVVDRAKECIIHWIELKEQISVLLTNTAK
jgi:hypothetical protein